MKTIPLNQNNDWHLERAIRNILSRRKFLFPTNETELEELILELKDDHSQLPTELDDSSRIFRASEKRYLKRERRFSQPEDYALAARNGGKISIEQVERILNKIKSENPGSK
jgi:hypothetical protein